MKMELCRTVCLTMALFFGMGRCEATPHHLSNPIHYDTPSFPIVGGGECGLLKGALIGVVGAALLKLPLLLAMKMVLLKIGLPLGLMSGLAPLAVPLLYMLLPSRYTEEEEMDESSSEGSPTDTNQEDDDEMMRAFSDPVAIFLNSPNCIEQVACRIGAAQGPSTLAKTLSWGLRVAEGWLEPNRTGRSRKLGRYRAAYKEGITSQGASCPNYLCSTPQLLYKQGDKQISLL